VISSGTCDSSSDKLCQACHTLIDKAYLVLELDDKTQVERLMEERKYRAEGIQDPNEYYESNMRNLSCKAHLRGVQGILKSRHTS
jgi:hypothetical protein